MTTLITETMTTVSRDASGSRDISGTAVPYGQIATNTEFGREAFMPGSFRDSVAKWMTRQDGARMAYRPAHREKPVGVVTALEDSADGVRFRASIFATPAGDEYLAQVDAGLNGVSIEAGLDLQTSKRTRDGVTVHRAAQLYAIAGSISPAYDGARLSLRDMEDAEDASPPGSDHLEAPARVRVSAGPANPYSRETPMDPETDSAQAPVTEPETINRDAIERSDTTLQAIQRSPVTVTRAEFVYGPNSDHSFLRDLAAMKQGDAQAAERQSRHNAMLADQSRLIERAGDLVTSEAAGAVPNQYLPGLLTPRILKGRPMGGFFNRVGITDARPQIFPKVTTSGSVAVQAAEGTNPAATDIATTAVTATPLLYGAYIDVSRQVIDGSSPAAESMVFQDLIEAYAQASETVIKTAVEAGATASGTAITAATPFAGTVGNVVAYYGARFKPATGVFIPSALFTTAMTQMSAGDGRPMWPYLNPSNAGASMEAGAVGGEVAGARAYLSYASTANVVVTARPEDYVIYESNVAQFSYDQIVGPAAVRLGIWAYLVVGTRLGSLKVTAA